jgi:hypothetical protein
VRDHDTATDSQSPQRGLAMLLPYTAAFHYQSRITHVDSFNRFCIRMEEIEELLLTLCDGARAGSIAC